jgi:hypothetical protein
LSSIEPESASNTVSRNHDLERVGPRERRLDRGISWMRLRDETDAVDGGRTHRMNLTAFGVDWVMKKWAVLDRFRRSHSFPANSASLELGTKTPRTSGFGVGGPW